MVTAYALNSKNYGLLIIAWIPYLFFVLLGIFNILRQSKSKDNPQLLPTRYTLTQTGITAKTKQAENKFKWDDFKNWQVVAGNFVLFHAQGFALAIPKKDIPLHKIAELEGYLKEYIKS